MAPSGSLFAANLAQLDDVEVWAYDVSQAHVDAINANGLRLAGAGDVVGTPRRDHGRRARCPPCDFGIVATKAMHTEGAIAATARAFADGAVATVQNGVGNEEVVAQHVARVIRGTTFPAGKILEPGVVQWDVKGDTTLGPFEPQPARRGRDRATRRRVHARRDAHGGRRGRATRAVAQGHLQRRDEPGRRAHRAHARPRLRAARPARDRQRARRRGKGRRRRRRGSRSTPTPRSSSTTRRSRRSAYGHKASMLQDVEARRATEIDFLNGGIARFGRELGVPTPAERRDHIAHQRTGGLMGATLSPELQRRHANVRAAMAAHDLDALVVAGQRVLAASRVP